MKSKGITQTDLVKLTALSKTTVSRICRNSNDKGCTYVPKRDVVMAVSVGLGLTPEEADALFLAAFPEEKIWRKILAEHMNIDQANEILYDNGLPLLGSMKDE